MILELNTYFLYRGGDVYYLEMHICMIFIISCYQKKLQNIFYNKLLDKTQNVYSIIRSNKETIN